MTRQVGQQQFITFVKGLNTEAGPLTFPENSTIEDINCVLTLKGSHKRRYGLKQEIEGRPLNVGYNDILYDSFKNFAINTYTWKAPANIGAKTFLVLQVVDKLLFYDISSTDVLPLISSTLEVSLTDLIVDEALFKSTGCSFSSGKGYLFVCGQGLEPCYITYDPDTDRASIKKLLLRIRDSVGVDDGLENSVQPTDLSDEHLYNLINQGWLYNGKSSVEGLGVQTDVKFKIGYRDIGGLVVPYTYNIVEIYYNSNPIWSGKLTEVETKFNNRLPFARNYITGTVSASGGYYHITFTADSGYEEEVVNDSVYIVCTSKYRQSSSDSETYVSTTGILAYTDATQQTTTPYHDYYSAKGKYPSNAQQWFVGRQEGQQINVNEVANFDFGNKRAPRGRCIIDPFTEDRSLYVPGLPSKTDTTRIIDTAFMGGRVFYLRQNSLLYSQVIEDIKQASMCYAEGDPTSEDGFDVVDTDGGVITITDMGDAIALFELQNGLAVFAKNGIWLVTGLSSDEGFKATGYSVRKLSNLECVARNSIVNVKGTPLFWTTSGIYVIIQRDYVGYEVQSLSDTTIQSRYVEIPKHNLKNVKGIYNDGAQRVAWFYDVTPESSLAEKEKETKALIYDVRLQAFYELETDSADTHPLLCAAFNTPYLSFISLDEEVYDNNGNVVYDNDNNIVYTKEAIKNTDLTDVKYLAFEKATIPAGPQFKLNDTWYIRDPSEDRITDYIHDYGWKDPFSGTVMMSIDVLEPTPSFDTDNNRKYYRKESEDAAGKYAWYSEGLPDLIVYTDNEEPASGDTVYLRIAQVEFNSAWYNRDTSYDDFADNYGFYYAWRNTGDSSLIYTAYANDTVNFNRIKNGSVDSHRYYRYPQEDRLIYESYHSYAPLLSTVYIRNDATVEPGTQLYTKNFFNEINPDGGNINAVLNSKELDVLTYNGVSKNYGGLTTDISSSFIPYGETVTRLYDANQIPFYKKKAEGTLIYAGLTSDYRDGYTEATDIVRLTSCNFDDTNFKDWSDVDYLSTFTTGANTCGDSFLTKDVVYLTTQLSRTEAVDTQGNIGNTSSCFMQMKWNFEDNDYSHKWTTPVQIYRARRLFAPSLDDSHFDDISIRMPVVTTKHKVRGDGKALQIKFTSETGKNFEVLGWNLIVGARGEV